MTRAGCIAAFCALLAFAAPAPKEVSIVKPEFYQYEGGPAIPANTNWLAGETIFFSFQVAGFQANEDGKISLSWSASESDPAGVALAEPQRGKVAEELATEDKSWLPKMRLSFQIPPTAPPGAYKIALAVKDELNGTAATKDVPFEVRGRGVEPSDSLVIRNYRYLHSEDDRQPMTSPVYPQGGAIWARFEITGYKYGERNRVAVEYGVSLLRPGGEALYSEPNAAAEKDQSFYPKRWVEGILSLKLDPDIARGEYTVVVAVRDGVGAQKYEGRYPFRVE